MSNDPISLADLREARDNNRLDMLGQFLDLLSVFGPDAVEYGGWNGKAVTIEPEFIRRAQAFWRQHYPKARDFAEFLGMLDSDMQRRTLARAQA